MERKDSIEKNMEFLTKELQKEWDVSKESKHKVTISLKDAGRIRVRLQQQIADLGELLQNDKTMTFKNSMKLCKENYVTLRVARKLITGLKNAEEAGDIYYNIFLDREEYSCFRKLITE